MAIKTPCVDSPPATPSPPSNSTSSYMLSLNDSAFSSLLDFEWEQPADHSQSIIRQLKDDLAQAQATAAAYKTQLEQQTEAAQVRISACLLEAQQASAQVHQLTAIIEKQDALIVALQKACDTNPLNQALIQLAKDKRTLEHRLTAFLQQELDVDARLRTTILEQDNLRHSQAAMAHVVPSSSSSTTSTSSSSFSFSQPQKFALVSKSSSPPPPPPSSSIRNNWPRNMILAPSSPPTQPLPPLPSDDEEDDTEFTETHDFEEEEDDIVHDVSFDYETPPQRTHRSFTPPRITTYPQIQTSDFSASTDSFHHPPPSAPAVMTPPSLPYTDLYSPVDNTTKRQSFWKGIKNRWVPHR